MKHKILVLCVALLLGSSCITYDESFKVMIPVMERDMTKKIETYETIVYDDFSIHFSERDYNPEPLIRRFFLDDFSKTLNKEVIRMQPVISYYQEKEKFTESIKKYTNALILTGNMKVEIQKKSVIRKKKDESGKKKNVFVEEQDWKADIEILLIDAKTAEEIFKKTYVRSLKDPDSDDTKFNLETLFFQASDGFIQDIARRPKIEDRYILTK